MKKYVLMLLCLPLLNVVAGIPAGYKMETITVPRGPVSILGVCHKDAETVAVCTWEGEVWERHDGKWLLFAEHLMEPNGILYDQKEKCYYVGQKPELTRLIDSDGDGRADIHENVCSEFGKTQGYHEYHFGPVQDSLGRKYGALNLAARGGFQARDGREGTTGVMAYTAPYRGWVYRSDRQGHFHPIASGFRSPCGIGMSPQDELFVTDNQGDWMPDCALFHVREGNFYGQPSSLPGRADFDEETVSKLTAADFEKIRTRPAVWLPRTFIANSPGSPVWDTTKGKFGVFKDQMFIGDYTQSLLMRCGLEKVGGDYQGFVIKFLDGTKSGPVKMEFDGEGKLWIAQAGRGWPTKGGARTALEVVSWDGKTVPFEMYTVSLTRTGFKITFTKPLSEVVTPVVTSWHYNYWSTYGSDRLDQKTLPASNAALSDDGLTLTFDVMQEEAKVYELAMPEMTSKAGGALLNRSAYYTLNKVLPAGKVRPPRNPLVPGTGWYKNDKRRPHPVVVKPHAPEVCHLAAPKDAVVLDASQWSNPGWKTDMPGVMKRSKGGNSTKESYGSARIHLEFMVDKRDDPKWSGQLWGNSGVFLMSAFELQVMNSYENTTVADGSCGAVWGQHPPLVNVSRPAGEWQSYDILMKEPEFSAEGALVEPMRLSVFHNGVLIHNDVAPIGPVQWPRKQYDDVGRRPLMLQDHKGSDVYYRNLWIVPDTDYEKSLDVFRNTFGAPPAYTVKLPPELVGDPEASKKPAPVKKVAKKQERR